MDNPELLRRRRVRPSPQPHLTATPSEDRRHVNSFKPSVQPSSLRLRDEPRFPSTAVLGYAMKLFPFQPFHGPQDKPLLHRTNSWLIEYLTHRIATHYLTAIKLTSTLGFPLALDSGRLFHAVPSKTPQFRKWSASEANQVLGPP